MPPTVQRRQDAAGAPQRVPLSAATPAPNDTTPKSCHGAAINRQTPDLARLPNLAAETA